MFNTVNIGADKFLGKVGILHRSLIDIGNDFKTLSVSGGKINNFSHLFNIATKQDIENFERFNQAVSNGVNPQRKYNAYLSSAPTSMRLVGQEIVNLVNKQNDLNYQKEQGTITEQEYARQMQINRARLNELQHSTVTQTAVQKALNVATKIGVTIFNTLANVAIGMAISFIISKIMELVNAQETYNQKIKEAAEQAKQEMSEITDLYSQYRELSKAVETDSGKKSDLIKVTDTLLEKLGYEKTKIQELADEYGNLDDAIKNITIKGLQEKEDALISDYALKKNNLITDSNWFTDWFFSDKAKSMTIPLSIDYLVEDDPNLDKVFDVIKNSGIFREVSESTLTLNNSNETVKGVLKNYDDISKAIDILKEKFSSTDLSDNKIFTALVTQQTALKTNIDSYNDAISNLNSNVAQQQVLTALLGKELPSTQEEFDSFKDSLLASAEASDEWKDRFVGGTDAAKEAIISVLRQMPEFADFFQNEIPDGVDNALPEIISLNDAFAKLKELLEDIIGYADTYQSAMKKIASGTGLTTDEVLKLLEIDPSLYDKFTRQLDGTWTIDLGAIRTSYQTKIIDGGEKAVEEERKKLQTEYDKAKEYLQSLEEEYNNFDDSYGYGTSPSAISEKRFAKDKLTEDIKNAKDMLKEAEDALGAFNLKNDLLDYSDIEIINELFDGAGDKIDDYNKGISSLNDAIDALNEGNSLSYDDMTKLVNLYPQLQDKVTETNDGYQISVDALEDVRIQSYTTRNDYIDDRIAETEALKEEVTKQIEEYRKLAAVLVTIENIGNDSVITLEEYLTSDEKFQKLQQQLQAYDDVINKLQGYKRTITDNDNNNSSTKTVDIIQQQIDYYKTLLEAIEIVTDKVIDSLEQEKEALKEKNDEQQRELDLLEAKNNLEKAKKQKVFVYKEGQGLVQVQDEKAVKDAQKKYDDIQNEIKEAEIDKQIDNWTKYKEQFSDMENNVKDTLIVEQAKKALGTDEKGLLSLDEKTITNIRDGLAESVYKKDVEDNKDNNKYVTVDMDTYLKQLGATVSWAEFQNIANNISSVTPLTTPMSNSTINNAQTINNTKTINSSFQFNIYDALNPQKVVNEVQGYLKKLLTETINSTK